VFLPNWNHVVLKNFVRVFLHQSYEQRKHTEKLMKLQHQGDDSIFLQDIKNPDCDGQESQLDRM
ncbi:Ferritin, heavy polypeptide 1, partial [Sigmodon hispidus]